MSASSVILSWLGAGSGQEQELAILGERMVTKGVSVSPRAENAPGNVPLINMDEAPPGLAPHNDGVLQLLIGAGSSDSADW